MRRLVALAALALSAAPLGGIAQGSLSQAQLQDDCLQRLKPMVPREVKPQDVSFSALGNYATYYVVTWRFAGALANGQRSAACTYRREGQWVRDDAAAYQALRDMEPRRRAKTE
jgi:hypothetical protein